jgi:hypothetical protein
VLIRVHRCSVVPGREWEFNQGIRNGAIPWVAALEGVDYSAFGRRIEGSEHHFINVTMWRDLDAVREHSGPDVHSRLIFDGAADLIAEDTIEYYEMIGPPVDEDAHGDPLSVDGASAP